IRQVRSVQSDLKVRVVPCARADRAARSEGRAPITTTIVHLVRHGEVHSPERILYGRMPGYRLSSRGQQMAQCVADHLQDADVALVRSSPLLREIGRAHV